jgi:hypothetical protein
MTKAVAIDSNALTYLIEANQEGYDPATDIHLGKERLAMIRTLFYSDLLLWVGPTVEAEYQRIPSPGRRDDHRRIAQYVLEDQPLRVDTEVLEARVRELKASHRGEADCRVVAETEFAGLDTLLSCDDRMLGAFTGVSRVSVRRPSEFWESLRVATGSMPVRCPAPGHPLFGKNWWRIGDA